jgi:hypothetical protein
MANVKATEWWEVDGRFNETQRFFLLFPVPGDHLDIVSLVTSERRRNNELTWRVEPWYENNIKIITKKAGHSGRAVWAVGLDRLDGETVGSNPLWGIDVCPRLIIIIHLSPYNRRYTVYLLIKSR